MKKFLIIGQGAAGSFLAWELLRRDRHITVIDDEHKQSSSFVSAGIINPVTGKRFAITAGFDQFFAHAQAFYRELETKFDKIFFEPIPILRVFQNQSEHDHWQRKVELNEGQQYSEPMNPAGTVQAGIKDELGSVVIRPSGFCHTARLLSTLKEYFEDRHFLTRHKILYDELTITQESVCFRGDTFDAVIFCEGYQAQWNPWFDWVPFNSVKGEILRINIQADDLPAMIINKGKWCVPCSQSQWLAGSSYIWDQLDTCPTIEARDQIVQGLRQCFDYPVDVVEHRAGVRPVIHDQKAILGRHPNIPSLAIFNGLGSKGFLMAPFFAAHLADYLCGMSSLREDINVARFNSN